MAKTAIIEAKPSRNNWSRLFDDAFEFDQYSLTSNPDTKKVLKRDVDIEIDLDEYEWVILVGADPFKMYTGLSGISTYTGRVVDEKFLPVINPGMIKFKPEAKKPWEESKENIISIITNGHSVEKYDTSRFVGIDSTAEAKDYITKAISAPGAYVALDSETTALYPRNGYPLGISLSYEEDSGAYILSECIDEEVEELCQELWNKKKVVFHNAKFDLAFLEFHFGWSFPDFDDTMLMHYTLDETQGSHGLKELALKHTKYGDYEREQSEWIKSYLKKHGMKKADFTFDLIPFEIIYEYAAIDAAVTFALYGLFKKYLDKNSRLTGVYKHILLPGCRMLTDIQDNGVPFDIERLKFAQGKMQQELDRAIAALSEFEQIAQFEKDQGKLFNPNSTLQLRTLLFDYIKLSPTGKRTSTGAHSTDAEVLEQLSESHPIPEHILSIRRSSKIKNTYLDKIIPQLDNDSRLRTNFNLHTTTSGRLSSSGKLNLQQLPRDNPAVKGCIRARPGYKIVAMDLQTAEVYIAAVVSDDLELQDVFRSGGDFHSTITKQVFNLKCPIAEVKDKHPELRQACKAISFGILYGASANKIADTAGITKGRAQEIIDQYFTKFWKLKEWIDETQEFIRTNAYIYSPLGRKRRLPNVRSNNSGVVGHEIRSGLNFIIQSVASDINLLGAIDTNAYLQANKMQSRMFALVHDSVLAEVPENEVDEYIELLGRMIQKDRGVSIPGCPINCDFDVADDYSLGKFGKTYQKELTELGMSFELPEE